MSALVDLSASAVSGGLFGFLGTVAGRVMSLFEKREARKDRVLELEHETKKWGHESALLTLQMQAKAEETERDISLAETAGAWSALSESQKADAAIRPSYPWVDAIRALTRPTLTLMLWVICFAIFLTLKGDYAKEFAGTLIQTAAFAATAATLWWFGDRMPRRG
jgi:hypothetical protein